MSKHKNLKILGGVILAIGFIYWASGGFNGYTVNNLTIPQQSGIQTPAPVTTTTTTTTSTSAPYSGQLTIALQESNALDNTVVVKEGTNLKTSYFASSDGIHFAPLGNGNQTITMLPSYNGILYASIAVPSGQNFFVAPKTIQDPTLNPSITTYDFMDVTGLGTKTWVFQINLANAHLPPLGGGQLAPTLTLNILAYGYAAPTINQPTSISSQATGTDKTNTVYWILSGTNKDAIPISEVDISLNATTTAKYGEGLFFVTIPNVGNVYLNQMNKVIIGSNSTYQYKFQNGISSTFGQPNQNNLVKTLKSANYVVVSAQGGTQIQMPVQVDTTFGSGDGLQVTLWVYYIQPSQTESSVHSCVRVVTAANVISSC